MGDTITVLNNLAADPAFHALSDDEQKAIIQKVRGTQAPALPGGLTAPPPVNQNAINAKQVKPVESFTGGAGPSGYMFGNPKSAPEAQGNIIDILRNIVPPAAGALGSAGGALGSVAAFTGSDALLKQLKPGNKESIPESLQNSLTQAAINEAGGRIIGGLWKAGKAFTAADQPEILKFLPTASQALKAEGKSPTTSSILKYVEDHFAPGAKAAAQESSAAKASNIGYTLAGRQAGRSASTISNPNDMVSLLNSELGADIKGPADLDKLLSDPVKIQEALTSAQRRGLGINARQDLAGSKLARIQQEATEVQPDGGIRLNSQKLFEQFDNPDNAATNKILFGSNATISNIRQFYKNVAATQDKAQGFGGFGKLRLAAEGIALTGGIARGLVTMNPLPAFVAAAPIAIEVGLSGLAKTLTNPKTARLMLALANNEALGVSDEYAARQLMQTLKGTAVNLVQPDGTKTPARIQDGKLVPVGQ